MCLALIICPLWQLNTLEADITKFDPGSESSMPSSFATVGVVVNLYSCLDSEQVTFKGNLNATDNEVTAV